MKTPKQWLEEMKLRPCVTENDLLVIIKLIQEDAKTEKPMRKFRIESRWPKWAKWRTVTPMPHSEVHKFDSKGCYWETWEESTCAKVSYEICNDGEFRIVEDITP